MFIQDPVNVAARHPIGGFRVLRQFAVEDRLGLLKHRRPITWDAFLHDTLCVFHRSSAATCRQAAWCPDGARVSGRIYRLLFSRLPAQ
jgi:hypothetical protein